MRQALYSLLLVLVLALLLPGAPAHADDAADRLHDAYILEVIEGKVDEAARVYLALDADEQIPSRIRLEARFRFAICAVLLGRADEGRAHLSALAENEAAPAALRARARAYLESIAEIGIGSELDKKLQALVFDLGRAKLGSGPPPPVYRDFEIIGAPAVPFLKTLLSHSDPTLRRHAFRLLCRLDAPGLGTLWQPGLSVYPTVDFVLYLKRHPEERMVFERRAQEMGTRAWTSIRYFQGEMPFSPAFMRAFAESGVAPTTAVAWLGRVLGDAEFEQLLAWMGGSDDELADAALSWMLRNGDQAEQADAALFRRVLDRLFERLQDPESKIHATDLSQFAKVAARLPASEALAALGRAVEDAETHGGDITRRAARAIFQHMARVLDARALPDGQAARYADLLLRWYALYPAARPGAEGLPMDPRQMDGSLATHLRHAIEDMAREQALALVRTLFAVPGRANHGAWAQVLPKSLSPRNLALWTAAIEAAPADQRDQLLRLLRHLPAADHTAPLAYRRRLDQVHRGILPALTPTELRTHLQRYDLLQAERPATEARAQVRAMLEAGRALPEEAREALLETLVGGGPEYFVKVIAPMTVDGWASFDARERAHLIMNALQVRRTRRAGAVAPGGVAEAAAAVLRPHLQDVPSSEWLMTLQDDRRRYPLEAWVPLLDPEYLRGLSRRDRFPVEEADPLARKLVAGPAAPAPAVLGFVKASCSTDLQREVFDRELRSGDPARRRAASDLLDPHRGSPASAGALEAAVAAELALSTPERWAVRRFGRMLLGARPSEALFPVARMLLAATAEADIMAGIDIADALGREDLIPALLPHLRSLNSRIRTHARKAVASIRSVAALAAEVEAGAK